MISETQTITRTRTPSPRLTRIALLLGLLFLPFAARLALPPVLEAQTPAPGTVQKASPSNGASNQSPTLTLSWNAPTGSISGSTTYTVSLWAAGAPPNGHLLGNLASTTALSATVPAREQLFHGQMYY